MTKLTYKQFQSQFFQPDLFGESHAPPTLEIHKVENNPESQAILNNNVKHFKAQCKVVLDALMRGERLQSSEVTQAPYRIGDLRARIRDLRKDNYINVSDITLDTRYKEYFLEYAEIKRLIELYKS